MRLRFYEALSSCIGVVPTHYTHVLLEEVRDPCLDKPGERNPVRWQCVRPLIAAKQTACINIYVASYIHVHVYNTRILFYSKICCIVYNTLAPQLTTFRKNTMHSHLSWSFGWSRWIWWDYRHCSHQTYTWRNKWTSATNPESETQRIISKAHEVYLRYSNKK